MDNRLRMVAGSTFSADPRDRPAPAGRHAFLAGQAGEDLLLMGSARVNILLAGGEDAIRPVFQTLLDAAQPVWVWSPGEPLVLPSIEQGGTLVLHEVGALSAAEQTRMLEWSARAVGRTRVVSTTSMPLLPRVLAGSFADTLYYRLNTVYVDVTGLEEAA